MNLLLWLLQTTIPFIVTLSLSTASVQPGERVTLSMVITGNTSALVTLQPSSNDVRLERLQQFGSPAGECAYDGQPNVCYVAVGEAPVLIVATYYVNPSARFEIYSITADVADLNYGEHRRIERGFKVGIVEQPAPIDLRFKKYLPIVL